LVPSCRTNKQPSVSREPVSLTQFDSSRPSSSAGGLEGRIPSVQCPDSRTPGLVDEEQPQTDATPPATGHWPLVSGTGSMLHALFGLPWTLEIIFAAGRLPFTALLAARRKLPDVWGTLYGWFIARRAGTDTCTRTSIDTTTHTISAFHSWRLFLGSGDVIWLLPGWPLATPLMLPMVLCPTPPRGKRPSSSSEQVTCPWKRPNPGPPLLVGSRDPARLAHTSLKRDYFPLQCLQLPPQAVTARRLRYYVLFSVGRTSPPPFFISPRCRSVVARRQLHQVASVASPPKPSR